jgi:hypothetical protein
VHWRRRAAGTLEGDRRLWEYLPVVFAIFLAMMANNEAAGYNLAIEGPTLVSARPCGHTSPP